MRTGTKASAERLVCRVLTTTACNARCAYCYEKGTAVLSMDDKTAEETARFLAARSREAEAPVRLEWFGGEPTLRLEPADRICELLRREGIAFRSAIVTNGLLVDRCLRQGRPERWNLNGAQITLDGTAPYHERVKGLPAGAFARILDNVRALAEAQIAVKLRLNLEDNDDELAALIELLGDLFAGNDRIRPYISPVYTAGQAVPRETMLRVLALNDLLVRAHLADEQRQVRFAARDSRCFMMTPLGFTIAPDGRLYNCSHVMTEDQCVGSVFHYDPADPVRQRFLRPSEETTCASCEAYSICRGGCRIGELGLAPMPRCHPYRSVLKEISRPGDRGAENTFAP